jgi:hypothetical protein
MKAVVRSTVHHKQGSFPWQLSRRRARGRGGPSAPVIIESSLPASSSFLPPRSIPPSGGGDSPTVASPATTDARCFSLRLCLRRCRHLALPFFPPRSLLPAPADEAAAAAADDDVDGSIRLTTSRVIFHGQVVKQMLLGGDVVPEPAVLHVEPTRRRILLLLLLLAVVRRTRSPRLRRLPRQLAPRAVILPPSTMEYLPYPESKYVVLKFFLEMHFWSLKNYEDTARRRRVSQSAVGTCDE